MTESPKNVSVANHPRTAGRSAVLSDDAVEMIAAMFRTVGDPTRIRVLEALNARGRATGSGLADRLGLTQQAVSKQLGVLHQAGIVRRRRAGAWVYYELIDWTGWWLIEQVAASLAASSSR
jgi:DNA-binding transcriptional ArsR family regulator